MRISDWSSDVCSSDLLACRDPNPGLPRPLNHKCRNITGNCTRNGRKPVRTLNRPIEMHPDPACFIGIDIGTQGARAVLMDHQGNLLASGEEGFPLSDDSREEQSPEDWWMACLFTLRALIRKADKDRKNVGEGKGGTRVEN